MIRILLIAKRLLVLLSGGILVLGLVSLLSGRVRFFLLGTTGANLTLFGFNETGHELVRLALRQRDGVTGDQLRAFSVQHSKNGNYDIATAWLDQAIVKDPEVKGYYGWLLLYYYRDYERSLELLEECDALTPGFSDAPVGENIHYLKGLAWKGMGRNEEALQAFDTYIGECTAEHGEAWVDVYAFVNKGIAHANLGRHEQALVAYATAIGNYPNCTEAYYYRAMALQELGRCEEALEDAKKANELIGKGYKHTDAYVELFEEVYPAQTEQLVVRLRECHAEKKIGRDDE